MKITITLAAALAMLLGAVNSSNAALTDGLVGYYNGEDNNNHPLASDPDSLSNTGVDVGVAGGIVGNAFEFDDTPADSLQAATSYSATVASDLGDSFTVAAWYNLDLDADPAGNGGNRHFVWENASDFDFSYWIDNDSGLGDDFADRAMFVDDATTDNIGGTGDYEKGTWEHAVQTISTAGGTTTVTLYINGALAASDTGPTAGMGSLAAGLEDIGINFGRARTPASDRPFDGKIDEIGIWSRVLTDVEIRDAYNLGLAGQPLAEIPEPASMLLISLGSLLALGLRRRK